MNVACNENVSIVNKIIGIVNFVVLMCMENVA
jgi:hypothetical protein